MRTFKQFKVGEIEYNLSFDYFSKPHLKSPYRCYLRITSLNGKEFILRIDNKDSAYYNEWQVYIPSSRMKPSWRAIVESKNKSQEVKRSILNWLINDC